MKAACSVPPLSCSLRSPLRRPALPPYLTTTPPPPSPAPPPPLPLPTPLPTPSPPPTNPPFLTLPPSPPPGPRLPELPRPVVLVDPFLPSSAPRSRCCRPPMAPPAAVAAAAVTATAHGPARAAALRVTEDELTPIAHEQGLLLEHTLCFLANAARDHWEAPGFRQSLATVWAPCPLCAPARAMGRVADATAACILAYPKRACRRRPHPHRRGRAGARGARTRLRKRRLAAAAAAGGGSAHSSAMPQARPSLPSATPYWRRRRRQVADALHLPSPPRGDARMVYGRRRRR